jgi:hypothetical protein
MLEQPINERRSGVEILCPGWLQRRSDLLFSTGWGRTKRLWILDSLEHHQMPDRHGESPAASAARPSILFALALSLALLASRAIAAQAKAFHRDVSRDILRCLRRLRPS